MKRRRFREERRSRIRFLRERTVVVCGDGTSRSRSGRELEKRIVRWYGTDEVDDADDSGNAGAKAAMLTACFCARLRSVRVRRVIQVK